VRTRIPWKAPTTFLSLAALAAAVVYAPAPANRADLAITKTDSPDPVAVGSTLTYTIQVFNLGPQAATGVKVKDDLPGHVTFVSATSSSGACEHRDKRVTCTIGDLAADVSKANAVTIAIQVRPTKSGRIDNAASVDGAEKDPVGANDKAKASTTVVAAPPASTCHGVAATVTGTSGDDRLLGTGGRDVIAGRGGEDTILSFAGRDLVCAGRGADRVRGGSAGDRLFGNAGPDVLRGGRGADRLRGGRGFDRCLGGPGFDRERGCEL
jgi:uncharacterized repeat protein (TIGR01451 family)